ncbi:MAG: AI-2E family transporter [Dehalococcoidia bacterium]
MPFAPVSPQYNDELQSVVARVAPDQVERLSADSLINQGIDQLGVALSRATGFAVSASSVALRTLIVLVMGYFMAVEADFSQQVVMRFAPPPYRARVQRLLGRIGVRLGHWARAQLLLAVFFGLTFGLGLRVMGVPYSVTLGVIGGVIEIIPYVGGFITLVLAVLLAATKSPLLIAGVVIWYTVVVQTQSHVLAPVLLGRVVGMHPIVVVIALFVGIEAIGLLGALLAVPIAVVLQTLLDEFYVFGASLPEPAGGDFVARAPPWREADRVPTATGDGPETGA